ncbi:glycosyltransferase family 4 protein [Candidatus Izimaplasma bacterium ZiA1]|uniref:glycosyltransferase family 4 protein n=1 Tax=Candidatus Izimoplasma sp. ZiA1 TaxID=2024899 RepID=UPI00143A36FE
MFDKLLINKIGVRVYVPTSKNVMFDASRYGEYTKIIKTHRFIDKFFFSIKINKTYNKLNDEFCLDNYDVIHAHSLFSDGFVALKCHKKNNKSYIVAVRNTDINFFFRYFFFLRKRGVETLLKSKRIVVLSQSYKEQLISRYVPAKYKDEIERKTKVVTNGIDDYWLIEKNQKRTPPNDEMINILHVANIDKNKNVLMIAKACEQLISDGYNVTLNIVGKVVSKNIFRKINTFRFVNYHGVLTREELTKQYSCNQIFVMISKYETFGLVYAEAMSRGLPVMYTKNQGFDGLFSQRTIGSGVEYNNVEELVKEIKFFIEKKDFSDVSNHCIKSCGIFSWKKISKTYMDIYEKATN